MADNVRRNPRTASLVQSIFREIPEDVFRRHLVELEERTNAVPIDPTVFELLENTSCDTQDGRRNAQCLPIALEQQIVNDFAWIAAVEEGAQSVAACYLQQSYELQTTRIRLAAVDAIDEKLALSLRMICQTLSQAAKSEPAEQSVILEFLFRFVLDIHSRRILGRLRSRKWIKPAHLTRSHKKPLWQDFANLKHRAQFLYTKKQETDRQAVEKLIEDMQSIYQSFEERDSCDEDEAERIAQLVIASLLFSQSSCVQAYLEKLESVRATAQVAAAIKCLRQVEKVAAYRRVCQTLIVAATRYPRFFRNIGLEFSVPYAHISTSIGLESWARTCHVHAEVQLIIDYDMMQADTSLQHFTKPRVVGTSKDLCFLCYLFMQYHRDFQPRNTHGRLYDQWTVPDLTEFSDEQRQHYRNIIQSMDNEVVRRIADPEMRLVEPMTSRQDLRCLYTEVKD